MSDYPMLISNKLHSFRNFSSQRYKEILQKPEKHLLKTAKDMLRCFFRQLYISAYARTLCLTPGCQTYQDPDVRHAKTRVSDISRTPIR